MSKLARLKPHDGKRNVRRSYTVFGIKFVGERGWYKVDEDVAAYLKTVKQREEEPDGHDAFDVCTPEEARAIDEREKKQALRREAAQAEEATAPARRVHNVTRPAAASAARAAVQNVKASSGDLTTADLRRPAGGESAEADAEDDYADADAGPVDAAPELSGEFSDDMTTDEPEASAPAVAPSRPSVAPKRGPGGKKPPSLL